MNINNIHNKKLAYCKTIVLLYETRRNYMLRIITATATTIRTIIIKTKVIIIQVDNNHKLIYEVIGVGGVV